MNVKLCAHLFLSHKYLLFLTPQTSDFKFHCEYRKEDKCNFLSLGLYQRNSDDTVGNLGYDVLDP